MSYGKSIDFLFNQMRNGSIGSLAGGNINFYYAGTTTRKPVYLDRDMTQPVTTAYTLSADGTAELYGDGLYRIIVKSSAGVTIYDYDDVSFVDLSSQLDTALISDRDLFYQMTLNGVQFKQCHRDVFDAADTVVLGGSPLATYSALDFSYYGQSGSTITTPNVITSGTYSRAWLYVQADTAAAVTHEYSTDAGVTWSAVAVDGYISASFSSLLIRTTWGGPGKIYSYGLFYDYYGAYTVIPAGIYSSVTFDTLADAITQIGTASATLRIENGISVGGGAAQTIPSNISVVVDKVGSISLDQNLIINGSFEAGLYQVFTGSGAVTFGTESIRVYEPKWFYGKTVASDAALFKGAGFSLLDTANGKTYKITIENGLLTPVEV